MKSIKNHIPSFEFRDVYHFLTPWQLRGLSVDTFGEKQWREHLDRIRRLGANRILIDFWANQYYHPDHPETCDALALWNRLRSALAYARSLGLRTGVVLFPCQVPSWFFERYPHAQALEADNYHGINMCWSKGHDLFEKFDRQIVEYFRDALDDVVVEFQDPGACHCADCCDGFPQMVLDVMKKYRSWLGTGPGKRVDLCTLHFRDWIEEPAPGFRTHHPVTGLREKVFSALDRDTVILDIDQDTIDLAHRHGLKTSYFFFELDPESGLPDMTVFPRPKLQRIPQQIRRSLERGDSGIFGYRLMPATQFIADEILLRMSWDASLTVDEILKNMAVEFGLNEIDQDRFTQAVMELEAWWQKGEYRHLAESARLLNQLPGPEKIRHLRDLVDVLSMIGEYRANHLTQVLDPAFFPDPEFVQKVYHRMKESPVFNAFTIDQHWEVRARELIALHLRWWLQGISRELASTQTDKAW